MTSFLDELFSLDGRHAIVTGGATGIGEGIARALAGAGAAVTIADIDTVGAHRVASDIGAAAIELDVTDPEACADVLGSTGAQVDVLVNNAGSYHCGGSILDLSVGQWQNVIDINLASVFNCSKPVAERMVDQGWGGAIINIASVDGGLPCLGVGYDTAKAGVIHFTRSLAIDLAPHQITVNAVSPGVVPVPTLEKMHRGEIEHFWPKDPSVSGLMGPITTSRSANVPIGRTGTPADIAAAVLFFASPGATYVTGQNLYVDGGWMNV